MRFIVTGSEGFIGKALVRHLSSRGAEVIKVDNALPDYEPETHEAFAISHYLKRGGIDCVFHLAGKGQYDSADDILDLDMSHFHDASEACAKHGVKLVFASSSLAEDEDSAFGIACRWKESLSKIICKESCAVRLHSVYGCDPKEWTLLHSLLNDENTVVLFGNGETYRHYTYIGDAVQGLLYAYATDKRVVNCFNPEVTSAKSFVMQFKEALDALEESMQCGIGLGTVHLIEQLREGEKWRISPNREIFNVPLQYASVSAGLRNVVFDRGTAEALVARRFG